MADFTNEIPNQNDCDNQATGYLAKAAEACASGDLLLGIHLYLAAYERAVGDPSVSTVVEVTALREAWQLACSLKERSMAEYVFEKLEPYLTGEEIADCAMQLQELALDRLEQFGISREDLEGMAETISQDLLGEHAHVVKVDSISIPNMGMFGVPSATIEATVVSESDAADAHQVPIQGAGSTSEAEDVSVTQGAFDAQENPVEEMKEGGFSALTKGRPSNVDMGVADVNEFNPYDEFKTSSVGKSYHAATVEGSGAYVFTRDNERATELARAKEQEAKEQAAAQEQAAKQALEAQQSAANAKPATAPLAVQPESTLPSMPNIPGQDSDVLTYRNLAGYADTVSVMRDMGIGLQSDQGFKDFVSMMNSRHGLSHMPTIDTLMFRSPVIEDAMRFAEATVGELGLPMLRMEMEEGVGGAPVLCVSTHGNNRPRMNHAHNRFEGPGVLIIENLDEWAMPDVPENPEGIAGFVMANISRGAREAVNLIRSAVEDPNVFVLVTASTYGEPDPFFYELLEPITIVDIGLPNEQDRASIWNDIAIHHPSISGINRDDLMRYSEGLARYDMYMAAREAVEDAYKQGLVQRSYVPVTLQNLYDKLAACQPLDSEQYRALEQAVVDEFRNDLDHLEDLLDGPQDS